MSAYASDADKSKTLRASRFSGGLLLLCCAFWNPCSSFFSFHPGLFEKIIKTDNNSRSIYEAQHLVRRDCSKHVHARAREHTHTHTHTHVHARTHARTHAHTHTHTHTHTYTHYTTLHTQTPLPFYFWFIIFQNDSATHSASHTNNFSHSQILCTLVVAFFQTPAYTPTSTLTFITTISLSSDAFCINEKC